MIPLTHRVWLGPHPPPAEHDYSLQWACTNPARELVTWTDENVHHLFPLVCQAEYDEAPTYVHRADLILDEAVYQLGGVAVGYDMEALHNIDTLIDGHDCWCTPDADGFAGGAFFGAIPQHRAIAHVLDTIRQRIARDGWHPSGPHLDTGPWAWGEAFGRNGEHCTDYGMTILGDVNTAYPVHYNDKHLFDDPAAYAEATRDSYVVHKFAGSWLSTDVKVR